MSKKKLEICDIFYWVLYLYNLKCFQKSSNAQKSITYSKFQGNIGYVAYVRERGRKLAKVTERNLNKTLISPHPWTWFLPASCQVDFIRCGGHLNMKITAFIIPCHFWTSSDYIFCYCFIVRETPGSRS